MPSTPAFLRVSGGICEGHSTFQRGKAFFTVSGFREIQRTFGRRGGTGCSCELLGFCGDGC